MAEDRYGLAPLRDVRARSEQLGRGLLASAIGDVRVTELQLAATRARTEAARLALHAAVATRETQHSATQLVLAERYISRRRRELEAARDEELRASLVHTARDGAVDVARGQLARARAEREVVERHFATWRETQRRKSETRAD